MGRHAFFVRAYGCVGRMAGRSSKGSDRIIDVATAGIEADAASMSVDANKNGSIKPRRPRVTWALLAAAVVLLVIAWLLAHHPPVPKVASLDEVSLTYNFIVAAALPWFAQWAAVACAILACCRSRNSRQAAFFSIGYTFAIAATWWSGLIWRFRGMDGFDAMLEGATLQLQLNHGASDSYDHMLFEVIGPMLGSLQLHSPLSLRGWDFLFVLLSTTLFVGYLLLAWRFFRFSERPFHLRDIARMFALVLPCYLPCCIRLGMRIARPVQLF